MVVTPKVVALAASLGVLLASCLADPEHSDWMVSNQSEQPIVILSERVSGELVERNNVGPGETVVVSGTLGEGECLSRGAWLLASEDGEMLARRDFREEPLCDREPWVWTGEDR